MIRCQLMEGQMRECQGDWLNNGDHNGWCMCGVWQDDTESDDAPSEDDNQGVKDN